jgi:SCY1-like protein 2
VQERALKVVPDLCETIDYAEVQYVLFPRVAVSKVSYPAYQYGDKLLVQLVFTKTRILTVKVATLMTFLAMVKTLDQVGVSVIASCVRVI